MCLLVLVVYCLINYNSLGTVNTDVWLHAVKKRLKAGTRVQYRTEQKRSIIILAILFEDVQSCLKSWKNTRKTYLL